MTIELNISALDLQDALDLAILIEKESEERYLWFSDMLGTSYPGDASDFFTMMAKNERTHGEELTQRRQELFGDAASRVTEDMIEDVEAPEVYKPSPYMSPRQALEVAMESEIKACEFFDQALAGIQDSDVRKLFEELRDEEIEHQNLLNKEKAKYVDSLDPDVAPEDIDTPSL